MKLPSINHPTDRPNFYEIETDGITFWYSYKTCIAFRGDGGLVIRENDWSVTTGRHLNFVNDDKSIRVSGELFEKTLEEL